MLPPTLKREQTNIPQRRKRVNPDPPTGIFLGIVVHYSFLRCPVIIPPSAAIPGLADTTLSRIFANDRMGRDVRGHCAGVRDTSVQSHVQQRREADGHDPTNVHRRRISGNIRHREWIPASTIRSLHGYRAQML
jgi:hypothetical protein